MREILEQVALVLGIGIPIFLLLRIFWLWYWKIDKVVELLGIIREELMEINENTKGDVK